MTRYLVAFSLVAACAVMGAGCGGGDERSSDTDRRASASTVQAEGNSGPKATSRARYLRRGNQICTRLIGVAQRIRGEDLFTADRRDLPRGFRRLAAAVERALKRLRALGVPRGDETVIARFHEQARGGLNVLKRAQHERRLAIQIANGQLNPFAAAAKSARVHGLTKCVAL